MLKTGVVMLMVLIGHDGTVSKGVVSYDTYDACYRSLRHAVNENYSYSDRVCMDAGLYDQMSLPAKSSKPGHGGLKSDSVGPYYVK